jgi:carbohydrate-binding DOMON domain-containing protein
MKKILAAAGACLVAGAVGSAQAGGAFSIKLKDPKGDDKGPGGYVYPTDAVYGSGSFDLLEMSIKDSGADLQIDLTFNATLEDPWGMQKNGGANFSVQFVHIYVDTDHKPKSGELQAVAGVNANFAPESAFERVILISPQPAARVRQEVAQKSPRHKNLLVLPRSISAKGKTITALVAKKDLGDPNESWGWQALVTSNEGYPAQTDVLSRKVQEFEGPHRFGGGDDYDGDPHFLDILVSPAKGDDSEKDAQYKILSAYKSGAAPASWQRVVLPMVYGK